MSQNFFVRSGLPLTVLDGATAGTATVAPIPNFNGNLIPGSGQSAWDKAAARPT